jgi:hypothetical protein
VYLGVGREHSELGGGPPVDERPEDRPAACEDARRVDKEQRGKPLRIVRDVERGARLGGRHGGEVRRERDAREVHHEVRRLDEVWPTRP